MKGDRRTVKRSMRVGKGTGPTTREAGAFGCVHYPLCGLIQHAMVIRLQPDTNLVFCHLATFTPSFKRATDFVLKSRALDPAPIGEGSNEATQESR